MCAGCLTPAPVADTSLGGRSGCTVPRCARAGHLQSFSSAARLGEPNADAMHEESRARDARTRGTGPSQHDRLGLELLLPWLCAAVVASVAVHQYHRPGAGGVVLHPVWRSSRGGPRSSPQDGQATRALHTRPRLNRRPRSRDRGGRPTTASLFEMAPSPVVGVTTARLCNARALR